MATARKMMIELFLSRLSMRAFCWIEMFQSVRRSFYLNELSRGLQRAHSIFREHIITVKRAQWTTDGKCFVIIDLDWVLFLPRAQISGSRQSNFLTFSVNPPSFALCVCVTSINRTHVGNTSPILKYTYVYVRKLVIGDDENERKKKEPPIGKEKRGKEKNRVDEM